MPMSAFNRACVPIRQQEEATRSGSRGIGASMGFPVRMPGLSLRHRNSGQSRPRPLSKQLSNRMSLWAREIASDRAARSFGGESKS